METSSQSMLNLSGVLMIPLTDKQGPIAKKFNGKQRKQKRKGRIQSYLVNWSTVMMFMLQKPCDQ